MKIFNPLFSTIKTVSVIALVTTLSACGGSDSDTTDTTAPDIVLNGSGASVTITQGDAYEELATASDNIDGDLTANIVIGGDTVDVDSIGSYAITYRVTDAANNVRAVTRIVNVVAVPDITIPTITLIGSATVEIAQGTIYDEQGATANDIRDGDISDNVVVGGDAVDADTIGTYSVTYNVSDEADNEAIEVTRTINVIADTTLPVITLIGSATVNIEKGTPYVDEGATANDNKDGDITDNILDDASDVDVDTVDTYTVTYTVSDAAGNPAIAVTRTVNVTAAAVIELTGNFSYSDVAGITVAGISYATETQSGITDASGAFSYVDGETITFSIGDTVIGDTVDAETTITPQDLATGVALYTTTAEVGHMLSGDDRSPERLAFNKFHNILSFLHTLDEDADPDTNGIVIEAGIAALFVTGQVDFEQSYVDFEDNRKLRYITHAAKVAGLLTTTTAAIKKTGFAIEHFYSAQGITHTLEANTKIIFDDALDNTLDNVQTYGYDPVGNVNKAIEWELSDDNPAAAPLTDSLTEGGYEKKYTFITDANGVAQKFVEDQFDWAGVERPYEYRYDTNGNLFEYDWAKDAVKSFVYAYVFDASGNRTAFERAKELKNGDFKKDKNDKQFTYAYDARGNLTQKVEVDESFTDTYTYTYTDSNDVTTTADDSDGEITQIIGFNDEDDQTTTVIYNTDGQLISEALVSAADATLNETTTYTYDATTGYLETLTVVDGAAVTTVTTHTYDAAGYKATSTAVVDDGITATKSTTFNYNGDGYLATSDTDKDEDGTADMITTFVYTGDKLMSETAVDKNDSDSVIETTTYEYVASTWVAVLKKVVFNSSARPQAEPVSYNAPPIK